VFESTPELLMRALSVVDRVNLLLADDNLESVAGTLANLETLSGVLAGRADGIDAVLAGAADVTGEIKLLATDLRRLTAKLDQRVEGVGDDVVATLGELQGAASRLDRMLGQVEQPVDDFAATGLYEFTQLIGETRLLVAALSRITKEFERDPAGFLIGRTIRGYEPE
jgi:phospholipid/cholesterol/gamma-HCH transport system substrate-binding protein